MTWSTEVMIAAGVVALALLPFFLWLLVVFVNIVRLFVGLMWWEAVKGQWKNLIAALTERI